jgi:hypothetical protein
MFNLIDLFQECSGGSSPFSCPFNFSGSGVDPSYFLNRTLPGYTPSTIGQFRPGIGWTDTVGVNGFGNYNRGVYIYRSLPTVVSIDAFSMDVSLFNGVISQPAFEIDLVHAGSTVHSTIVNTGGFSGGFNTVGDNGGPWTVDTVRVDAACGFQSGSDPGGSLTIFNFNYNVVSGGCA